MSFIKRALSDLALLGGNAAFDVPLHVAQLNFPSWERFESMFHGIFDRHYYSNHGVLAQTFEEKLGDLLGVRHVVTVTNATVGLSMAALALGLPRGAKVVVPSFTFPGTVQALTWAGLEPVFCEVEPATHMISARTVESVLDEPGLAAILGVHLGQACAPCGNWSNSPPVEVWHYFTMPLRPLAVVGMAVRQLALAHVLYFLFTRPRC